MRKCSTVFLLILMLFLSSCNKVDKETNNQTDINTKKIIRYFPEGIFSKEKYSDNFTYKWYSKSLIQMNEPSLYELSNNKSKTVYRFLYLGSKGRPPIVIRINIDSLKNQAVLNYKTHSNNENVNSGYLERNKELKLSDKDLNLLLEKLREEKFWTIPVKDNIEGLDGTEWIIEGVDNGNYHLVDRWTPRNGPVRRLGLLFIKLSHEKFDDIY